MRAFIENITEDNVRDVFSRAYKHAQLAVNDGLHQLVVRRAVKSRDQEEKYHAMIGDIARQYTHSGRKWNNGDMKRLLVDAFRHETIADPVNYPGFDRLWKEVGDVRLAPAIGRDGFVALGEQTRRFPTKLANGFITWLTAFGNEQGVQWSDPEWVAYMQEMKEAA